MNRRRSGAFVFLVLLSSLLLPGQAFAVTGTDIDAAGVYRAGVAASRDGDHAAALEHFRKARAAGRNDPALIFNLGVTLYRLGDYSASRSEFERLVERPAWRDIALYNLALIAQQQERETAAAELFGKVATDADDARLRQLALRQLEKTPARSRPSYDSTMAFLGFALGHDDNVVAFPEQLQQDSAAAADDFSELLLYGEHRVAGRSGDGVMLKGFGVTRRYAELDAYDSSAYGVGLLREQESGPGIFSWGGNLVHTAVDGQTVTTALQLDVGWQIDIDNNRYTFRYRPELHRGGGNYPQLDGSRHRLDVQWQHTLGNAYLRTAYRFETNSRDEVVTGSGSIFNYSPTRQQVRFSSHWPRQGNWRWAAGVVVGQSHYDGDNRLQDIDGDVVTARRKSDRLDFYLRGTYRITGQWRVYGELRNEQVDDTFELYSWDRNLWRFGIEFTF